MKIKMVQAEVRIPGIHFWSDAERIEPAVGYLAHPHRHLFLIRAVKRIYLDRQTEFIVLAERVRQALQSRYTTRPDGAMDFASHSCETIAEWLCDKLQLDSCTVLEDGENGSTVVVVDTKQPDKPAKGVQ